MNRWLLLTSALVAAGIVSGDFGLKIAIPQSGTVKTSIGAGITPIITANSSFKTNETVETSGAVTALRTIVSSLNTPFKELIQGYVNASTDKSGDPVTLMNGLGDLISTTASGIGDALGASAALETSTKPSWFTAINGNLSALADQVNALTSVTSTFGTNLDQANSAEFAFTARNITAAITPAMIATVTTPLKTVFTTISTIASLITEIGKDKNTAVILEATTNTTINAAMKSLVTVIFAFNKTASSTEGTIVKLSNTAVKSINQTYATILAKPASYNGGDMTVLNDFLTGVADINNTAITTLEASTQTLIESIFLNLDAETTSIKTAVHAGIKNITTLASTSESKFATTCEAKYAALLQQAPASISRLEPCIKTETTSFMQVATTATALFNDIPKSVGGNTAIKMNLCTITNGNCSVSYFSVIPNFSGTLQAKYDVLTTYVTSEQIAITSRVSNCATAVSKDIQDATSAIEGRFGDCLTTGK